MGSLIGPAVIPARNPWMRNSCSTAVIVRGATDGAGVGAVSVAICASSAARVWVAGRFAPLVGWTDTATVDRLSSGRGCQIRHGGLCRFGWMGLEERRGRRRAGRITARSECDDKHNGNVVSLKAGLPQSTPVGRGVSHKEIRSTPLTVKGRGVCELVRLGGDIHCVTVRDVADTHSASHRAAVGTERDCRGWLKRKHL